MQEKPFNIVFMGSPDFAVPCLRYLASDPSYNVVAAITQTDKPAGRGNKLNSPPVKTAAVDLGIKVFQPDKIRKIKLTTSSKLEDPDNQELIDTLNAQPIDAFVVVAYGLLIPKSIISFAKHGVINVHASILPRWRGAAPLQHAILNGDEYSGISLMQIDEGLDTGPVFTEERIKLSPTETLGSLHDKLSQLGVDSLQKHLKDILNEKIQPTPQTGDQATYAGMWEKTDCLIPWDDEAINIERRIRACHPIPGAKTLFKNEQVKILNAEAQLNQDSNSPAGRIINVDKIGITVACGKNSALLIKEMQFPGKKPLAVSEVLKGKNIAVGEFFTNE